MSDHEYREALREYEVTLRELERLYVEKVKSLEARIRDTHERSNRGK